MSIFTYPIKKSISLGTRGVMLGAKAGVGVVEHIARTATGAAKDDPSEEPLVPAESPAPTPTKVADAPAKAAKAPRSKAPKAKKPAKTHGDAIPEVTGTSQQKDTAEVHPLLVDKHVVPEEEVVYSSGPDIEEPIEVLAPKSDDEKL